MKINALRKELTALMNTGHLKRQPAIRRSEKDAWIYATDITMLISKKDQNRFRKDLDGAGWEYHEEHGWMLLRKTAEEPPEGWYDGSFGTEAGCCASLIRRHADHMGKGADSIQRKLIKAGEEGERAYENACRSLHRDWAERLRRGQPLPAVSTRYFGV